MVLSMLRRVAILLAIGSLGVEAAPRPQLVPKDGPQDDPFEPLDPQNWVTFEEMTWEDWKAPPGVDWADPTRRGSVRNFNIALVTVDYSDKPFAVTLGPHANVFGNPQPNPAANNLPRASVPAYYRDLLNTPTPLNRRHTLHEYWMHDSFGRFGVDLTAYGPYLMPRKSYQYGVDPTGFNPGACPRGETCGVNLRTDALGAWRREVGDAVANQFALVFILSAGEDESSTWQAFGRIKFQSPDDVPAAFGPPIANSTGIGNAANTRNGQWSSWAAAATIWPNAGGGSSTQGESSGMGTYAHELSHLLDIGDNYGDAYAVPPWRDYAGPFTMMGRGSFNGPGGPNQRWEIPSLKGGSLGSLHTLRDRVKIGLVDRANVLQLDRQALVNQAVVVRTLTSRAVDPGSSGLIGIFVNMTRDLRPPCTVAQDMYCDRGGFNFYTMEVVDRVGPDSFQPDDGVYITKSKTADSTPYQWAIDANPAPINVVDFVWANGTESIVTLADYRQLLDALFHAGTRSGSAYEYVDTANRLHFYILSKARDEVGSLSYEVGVRSLNSTGGAGVTLGIGLTDGAVESVSTPTDKGVYCAFRLINGGTGAESDVYRLKASVKTGAGWRVALPTEIEAVPFGQDKIVRVAVGAAADADAVAEIELVATSELKTCITTKATCRVVKEANAPCPG